MLGISGGNGGGGGSGDMAAATYDPQAIAGDAFDMDNMVEGADNDKRFFTAANLASLTAAGYAAYRRSQTSNTLSGNDPSDPQFIRIHSTFSEAYLKLPATSVHGIFIKNDHASAMEVRYNDGTTVAGSIPSGESARFWLSSAVWYMKLFSGIQSGYTTTATAAGTTTLTATSTNIQYFTGATTQTVVLPVTSTLSLGFRFLITNLSAGALTVNSSGGNLVATVPASMSLLVTCILTSGTSAASWSGTFDGFLTSRGLPLTAIAVQDEATIVGRAAGAGTGVPSALTADQVRAILGTGTVAQVVVGTVATKISTTTTFPIADSAPANTLGVELMTVAITPKVSTSNILLFGSFYCMFDTAARTPCWGIFKDSDTPGIRAGIGPTLHSGGYVGVVSFSVLVAASSTSARTYKLRVGPNSAAAMYLYETGSDDIGGTMQHAITAMEILA